MQNPETFGSTLLAVKCLLKEFVVDEMVTMVTRATAADGAENCAGQRSACSELLSDFNGSKCENMFSVEAAQKRSRAPDDVDSEAS